MAKTVAQTLQQILVEMQPKVRQLEEGLMQARSGVTQAQDLVRREQGQLEHAAYVDAQGRQQYEDFQGFCAQLTPLPVLLEDKLQRLSAAQHETTQKRATAERLVEERQAALREAESRAAMLAEKQQRLQQQLAEVRQHPALAFLVRAAPVVLARRLVLLPVPGQRYLFFLRGAGRRCLLLLRPAAGAGGGGFAPPHVGLVVPDVLRHR